MDIKILVIIVCFINIVTCFYIVNEINKLQKKTIEQLAKSEKWYQDTSWQNYNLCQNMAKIMETFINDLNDFIDEDECSECESCQNTEQSEQK